MNQVTQVSISGDFCGYISTWYLVAHFSNILSPNPHTLRISLSSRSRSSEAKANKRHTLSLSLLFFLESDYIRFSTMTSNQQTAGCPPKLDLPSSQPSSVDRESAWAAVVLALVPSHSTESPQGAVAPGSHTVPRPDPRLPTKRGSSECWHGCSQHFDLVQLPRG